MTRLLSMLVAPGCDHVIHPCQALGLGRQKRSGIGTKTRSLVVKSKRDEAIEIRIGLAAADSLAAAPASRAVPSRLKTGSAPHRSPVVCHSIDSAAHLDPTKGTLYQAGGTRIEQGAKIRRPCKCRPTSSFPLGAWPSRNHRH